MEPFTSPEGNKRGILKNLAFQLLGNGEKICTKKKKKGLWIRVFIREEGAS